MGRGLYDLVKTVRLLSERGVGLWVLTGQGAQIDTTTAAGRLSFGVFAALAVFENELIRERTMAGLQAANRDRSVSELCKEFDTKSVTLYRYVDPNGNLRDYGKRVLGA
jgi:DNA invertase Pin-like site-specific DNA recombinase